MTCTFFVCYMVFLEHILTIYSCMTYNRLATLYACLCKDKKLIKSDRQTSANKHHLAFYPLEAQLRLFFPYLQSSRNKFSTKVITITRTFLYLLRFHVFMTVITVVKHSENEKNCRHNHIHNVSVIIVYQYLPCTN